MPSVQAPRVDDIIEKIRASGGRVTQSRRMVVETIVGKGDHHLTAPELIEAMRAVDPEFHESTVYRVLERLTELHVVEQVQVHSGATVFHLTDAGHVHHHLLCSECGAVTETKGTLLDKVATEALRRHGFVLNVGSSTTLVGRCATCAAQTG